MVQRPTDRDLRGRRDIVRIGPVGDASSGDVAIARAAEQVGTAINAPLRQLARHLEQETVKEFEARGREQALSVPDQVLPNGARVPQIALREGTSLTTDAFNRGVLSVAPQRLQTALIEGMDSLEQTHRGDPRGFESGAQTLFDQLMGSAPDDLRAVLELDFTRRRIAGVQRQNKEFVDSEVSKVRSSNATLLEALSQSAARAAFNTITTNPEERQVNGLIVEDSREKLDEILGQVDPLGDPIYTPEEQRRARKAFEENIVIEGARGGFTRAVDKERYINAWVTRQRKEGELGLDLIDKVSAALLADLRVHNSLTASVRRQTAKEVNEAVRIYGRGQQPAGIAELRQRLGAVGDVENLNVLDRASNLQQDILRFRQSPLADQSAIIEELRSQESLTIEDSDRLTSYEMNVGKAADALRKDPIGWARQTEVLQGPAANPLTFQAADMLQRERNAQLVQDHFALRRQPFFRPGEADIAAQNFQRMTPPEAADAAANIGELSLASQRNIVNGLGESIPGLDVGVEMAMTDEGRAAALVYFEGVRAIQEAPNLRASNELIAEALDDEGVSAAYAQTPEALSSIAEAAKAIAAGLALRNGQLTSVEDQIGKAVQMASGGIIEFNDREIAPPLPGMDEDDFDELVFALSDDDLVTFGSGVPIFKNGTALSSSVLHEDMQFQSFGPGQYMVVDEAGRAVITSEGFYVIDLREAWLEGRGTAIRGVSQFEAVGEGVVRALTPDMSRFPFRVPSPGPVGSRSGLRRPEPDQ